LFIPNHASIGGESYRTHADPGLHAAAEWLLRKWGQGDAVDKIITELASGAASAPREKAALGENVPALGALTQPRAPAWFVNSHGQTFTAIPGPVEFRMGSPTTEAKRVSHETPHRRRIGRSFAIAATEVTLAQFRKFNPNFSHDQIHRAPTPDCPALGVTWYEAAEYCNWLSRQEGLPKEEWCYLPNQAGEYAEGMALAPNYLDRRGYRLPTEAEWEYSCRAGAETAFHYGETISLLTHYCRYLKNSEEHAWPVAGLKPNDLGLFGMHGNIFEWCADAYGRYQPGSGVRQLHGVRAVSAPLQGALLGPAGLLAEVPVVAGHYPLLADEDLVSEDLLFQKVVSEQTARVLRGGSWSNQAQLSRAAFRNGGAPGVRSAIIGFRLVVCFPSRTQ
jgi:formylglycine-generating enzyme required for sulfatase activity